MSVPEKRPSVVSSTMACVCHPNRRGSMRVVKPRITPSRRSRSTRRLTAGADSATCPPMSWKDRRASSRRSAMICRSISSTAWCPSMDKQRIDIDPYKQRNDHGVMATEALAGEATHVRTGERSGIPMVVTIHSTYLGRSLGGCRVGRYGELEAAVRDAERLSHAMTLKAAAAGLPLGGGKSVIALPQGESLEGERRHAALRDFADLLNEIDGRYVTAEDVGVGEADMAFLSQHTPFVVGRPAELGGSGDPSPFTAMGVEIAIRTALGGDLAGRAISVAGLGHVGGALAERLSLAPRPHAPPP